jgi:hypothetical protein
MKEKIKNLKREVIRKVAQTIADGLFLVLESNSDSKNIDTFNLYFDYAAKLNAYCIVFHDIYLD